MAIRNNPFRPILKKIPAPFKNKYFMVLIFFMAWMIFIDKHDVLTQIKLQQTLNKLEVDKDYYHDRIDEERQNTKDIKSNPEKFAREHYHLQKKDEDVFIFVEK